MRDSKHTPGPWRFNPDTQDVTRHEGNAFDVICRMPLLTSEFLGESRANAEFIAAAPETARQRDELLVALRAMREAYKELWALYGCHDDIAIAGSNEMYDPDDYMVDDPCAHTNALIDADKAIYDVEN